MAIFNFEIKKELARQNGSFQLSVSDVFCGANYRNKIGLLTTDAFESDLRVSIKRNPDFNYH